MRPKKILFITIPLSIILLLFTEPQFSWLNSGISTELENGLLAPLFYTLIGYSISCLILLFFNNQIFKLWLRKIVSWFLPFSLIVLFASSSSRGGVVSFDRTDYAIFLGFVLVVVTLVFTLVQKFYYKQ